MAAVVLVVITAGGVLATRHWAREEAVAQAEVSARHLADLVVAPLLSRALDGDASSADELRRAVDQRIGEGYLLEVLVWSADGTVVFADDPALVGRHIPVPLEVGRAIGLGRTTSGFADHPEAPSAAALRDQSTDQDRTLVEVYVPCSVGGRALSLEAYFSSTRVDQVARHHLAQILPLVLVPLLLLQLVQIPIALSLARQVRRHEGERSVLVRAALSASERERLQIASDLHDGPLQDLAGVALGAEALAASSDERGKQLATQIVAAVREASASLRRLMVEIYPPDLDAARLPDAIGELAGPLRVRGVEVLARLGPVAPLDRDQVTALYRVARESTLNVLAHAGARHLVLDLSRTPTGGGAGMVRLTIEDDGAGLDPVQVKARQAAGHLGMRLMRDRVEAVGGTLTLTGRPGAGTTVTVELPAGSA